MEFIGDPTVWVAKREDQGDHNYSEFYGLFHSGDDALHWLGEKFPDDYIGDKYLHAYVLLNDASKATP